MTNEYEVLYQVDGYVATITLNRPERLNAITRTMLDSLSARLLQANQDGSMPFRVELDNINDTGVSNHQPAVSPVAAG